MFNLFHFFEKLREQKKKKKLLNKPTRSAIKFKKKYPNYMVGANCYGLPVIKHQHPDASLRIGSYCSFAKNVQIFMGGNHRTDWVTTYRFPIFFKEADHIESSATTNGEVIIGNDVWLCENVTILSGITIGDGAVIANGAIVTKDVAAYSIVGGNPAKHIRWRFDEITRAALLQSAWWSWPEDELLKVVHLLCSDNLTDFLQYANNRISSKIKN
ncbi:MAG: CatB-related O-acetyltransferase [Methylophilaceae bacterium]|nr:CatB-related O-acetyltransferase [Methylophilaceae bacterium]